MLEIDKLNAGIKLRSLGRLLDTSHPFLRLIKDSVDLSSYFFPTTTQAVDLMSIEALAKLKEDRIAWLENPEIRITTKLVALLKASKLRDILSRVGRQSLEYFRLIRGNKKQVGDLDLTSYNRLSRHMDRRFLHPIREILEINVPAAVEEDRYLHWVGQFKQISKISAKEFRETWKVDDPIGIYKCGAVLAPVEALTWGLKLRKLTSTRHKNLLLKLAHGDLYTNERLHRFGLRADPNCERCGQVESLKHKILNCQYSEDIWRELERVIQERILSPLDEIEPILGMDKDTNIAKLTIMAETLQFLCYQNVTLPPRRLVKLILERLIRREKGENKIFIEHVLGNT
jgi:hypothetical protein